MRFADGTSKKTFGANATIYIDGSLEYDDGCRGGGIPDFAWAATDVDIIATERRTLANLGQDDNAIAALESAVAVRPPVIVPSVAYVLQKLDAVLAARTAGAAALSAPPPASTTW